MSRPSGRAMGGPARYDPVARALHWAMAALLFWQLGGMAMKYVLGRTPLMAFWVGSHASVGTLILLLLVVRALWAVTHWRARPPHGDGPFGRLAAAGHGLLYAAMLVVPLLAVLRMIGGGRPIALFGVTLRSDPAAPVAWMTAPANLLHGWLGWTLALLIAGHVAMTAVHGLWWRDGTFDRMRGGPGPAAS